MISLFYGGGGGHTQCWWMWANLATTCKPKEMNTKSQYGAIICGLNDDRKHCEITHNAKS